MGAPDEVDVEVADDEATEVDLAGLVEDESGSVLCEASNDELASAVWFALANDELIIALLLKLSFELFIDGISARTEDGKNRFDEAWRSDGDNVDDSADLSGDLSNL